MCEWERAATERNGNNLKGSKDTCLKNGSSQGQNLALTALYVPSSFDSGRGARVAFAKTYGNLVSVGSAGRRVRWGTSTMALHIRIQRE